MAVNSNPYISWANHRNSADYRCTDTQTINLVRNQLSQDEYLTRSNRVGPGPDRVKRTRLADNTPQVPNIYASDDMWGWQHWITSSVTFPSIPSPVSNNLKETFYTDQVPSATYYPYEHVGGATVSQSYELDYRFTWNDR